MRRGSCRYPLPTERPPYPHSLPAVFKRVLRILDLFSGLLPVSCRGTAYCSTPTDCHRCQHFESGRADQRADACMSLRLVIRLQPTCAHSRCRATLRLPRVSPRPLPAVVLQLPRRTGISRLLRLLEPAQRSEHLRTPLGQTLGVDNKDPSPALRAYLIAADGCVSLLCVLRSVTSARG